MPYIIKNGKTYVVLIKEFRYPINDYIYSIPAGIIDEGESPAQAAYRELLEKIMIMNGANLNLSSINDLKTINFNNLNENNYEVLNEQK